MEGLVGVYLFCEEAAIFIVDKTKEGFFYAKKVNNIFFLYNIWF